MNTQKTYLCVGIFVMSLLSAFIFGLIWLSSGLSFKRYDNYIVYMKESVSGLNPDAIVEYNGVGVGAVHQIHLNARNPNLVELILRIQKNTPITVGTVATLNIRGLTGLAYVALKDSGTDLHPLLKQPGQTYPVIKTAPSLLLRLDTALSQLLNDVDTVAKSVRVVLKPENREAFQKILINLQKVTQTLAQNNKQLDQILTNTAGSTKQLKTLVQSSLNTVKMVQIQTLPMTYRTLSSMNNMAQILSEISAEIKENPALLIRGRQ